LVEIHVADPTGCPTNTGNQRWQTDARERLTEQCRARLHDPIKRWIFSRSLRRAQELAVYREHFKNLAVRRIACVRRVLLALGQWLQEQGTLTRRDDIFFLDISELELVAAGGASFDWRERIEFAPGGIWKEPQAQPAATRDRKFRSAR
jgi:hypothetical protein